MLAYVPVRFDLYRQLSPRLWPVMQVLVAHADRAGCCWPSVRRITDLTGVPRSTVSRYLAALERAGYLSRTRKPGGPYTYTIAAQWLPSEVSHQQGRGVPLPRTEEDPIKKREGARARFEKVSELSDDRAKWEARLRSWCKSGFWLPYWGEKPGNPGCMVPAALIASPGCSHSRRLADDQVRTGGWTCE
jgi:DNA-binding transcriptional ArsR family regulator